MTIYVALLRGINVSRHNRIKMMDLKDSLVSLGLKHVQTYIQSGNVVFESDKSADNLVNQIENILLNEYNIKTTVVLRSKAEYQQLIRECPYADVVLADGHSVHVALLTEEPDTKLRNHLLSVMDSMDSDLSRDTCSINVRDIYFLLHQSILDSSLVKAVQRQTDKLTMRNWTTMLKMMDMLNGMNE